MAGPGNNQQRFLARRDYLSYKEDAVVKKPYLEPELEVVYFLTESIMSESSFDIIDGELELPAV